VIPENWYLQIGIELGIAGLLIYVMLVAILLIRLARCRTDSAQRRMDSAPFTACPSLSTFLWLLGLALAGLFLHSFEDAAVAYTAWILAAMSSTIVRPRS
jgi:O-antigen ligase